MRELATPPHAKMVLNCAIWYQSQSKFWKTLTQSAASSRNLISLVSPPLSPSFLCPDFHPSSSANLLKDAPPIFNPRSVYSRIPRRSLLGCPLVVFQTPLSSWNACWSMDEGLDYDPNNYQSVYGGRLAIFT